ACWHPLWFLRVAPQANTLLGAFPHLRGWMERMEALGEGQRTEMSPSEALAIARESRPAAPAGVDPGEPNGLRAGGRVAVTPDDYGFAPVAGKLVTATPQEVAVRRTDAAVGEVVVHFPRVGFRVTKVS